MAYIARKPRETPLAMALAVSMARDGWTQADLAAATDVASSTLGRIMLGQSEPGPHDLPKLLDYLQRRGRHGLLVSEPLEEAQQMVALSVDDIMARAFNKAAFPDSDTPPCDSGELDRFFKTADAISGIHVVPWQVLRFWENVYEDQYGWIEWDVAELCSVSGRVWALLKYVCNAAVQELAPF